MNTQSREQTGRFIQAFEDSSPEAISLFFEQGTEMVSNVRAFTSDRESERESARIERQSLRKEVVDKGVELEVFAEAIYLAEAWYEEYESKGDK